MSRNSKTSRLSMLDSEDSLSSISTISTSSTRSQLSRWNSSSDLSDDSPPPLPVRWGNRGHCSSGLSQEEESMNKARRRSRRRGSSKASQTQGDSTQPKTGLGRKSSSCPSIRELTRSADLTKSHLHLPLVIPARPRRFSRELKRLSGHAA